MPREETADDNVSDLAGRSRSRCSARAYNHSHKRQQQLLLPYQRQQPTAAAQLTPKTIQSVASSHCVQVQEQEEDVEATRVFKKRRTSSKAPVSEAQMFEEQVDLAADPKGDEWEDLDAEDADDPLVVSEHVVEIFKYMKEVEKTTMPNPLYMDSQKELVWTMRGILTDWLVQVRVRFHLMPETLFLAVNII